jgi:hypothetical protein
MMATRSTSTLARTTTAERLYERLRVGLSFMACLWLLGSASSVYAFNGENEQTVRVYNAGDCAGLRTTSGSTDAIVVCLQGQAGADPTCGRLVENPRGGGTVGFCADGSLGGGFGPVEGGALETDTTIKQTNFFSITNRQRTASTGSPYVTTYCQSFPPSRTLKKGVAPGEKICATFVPGVSTTPICSLRLPVVQNQTVCDKVAALLRQSIQPNAIPILVALISAQLATDSQPTELVACPAYGWQCSDAVESSVAGITQHSGHSVDTPKTVHYLSTYYPR